MKTHVLYKLTVPMSLLNGNGWLDPGLVDARWFKREFGIKRFNELRERGDLVKA